MIRIDRERYLKHMVTDLETLNEPSSTDFPVLGNYSCDSDFGNFSPLSSDIPLTQNSEISFQENFLTTAGETLFCQEPVLEIMEQIGGKEESGIKKEADGFIHKCGPYTLMDLNHKKAQGQGASSLTQKVNEVSVL
jgi:hypothetical protein